MNKLVFDPYDIMIADLPLWHGYASSMACTTPDCTAS